MTPEHKVRVLGVLTAVVSSSCQLVSNAAGYEYDSLQGLPIERIDDPEDFFTSIADFRERNSSPRPRSILLRNKPGGRWLQIAYGDGWVPGAFVVVRQGGDDNNICVAESTERLSAYDELFQRFQRGQFADRKLIRSLTEGANQPCDSFFSRQ